MTAEFDWWLLLVGIVAGAGLTWLVLADLTRHDRDVGEAETAAEAGWIARTLADEGTGVDPALAEQVLRAHRRYLGLPPPDALVDPTEIAAAPPAPRLEPPAGPPDAEARREAQDPEPAVSDDPREAGDGDVRSPREPMIRTADAS